jgi:hypothetical protein
MMRVYPFLVGTKANILAWINSEPKLQVKNDPLWEYPRLIVKGIDMQFIVVQVHAQAYQLIPESTDWKLVCKVIRRMKAAAPANVQVVSRKWIKQNYPAQFRVIFNPPLLDEDGEIIGYVTSIERCSPSISGDTPTSILDYDPTEDDILNDADPEPEDIGFPAEETIAREALINALRRVIR